MPNAKVFFERLQTQYANKLPFVVYSKPANLGIRCWLQEEDKLFTTSSFSESGFVFAPFNLEESTILFPQESCVFSEIELEDEYEDELEALDKAGNKTEFTKQHHINLISKGIEAITNGKIKKVVLSRVKVKNDNQINPLETFKRLFNTYKNAMVYCWYHPKVGLWLGATPELLFRINGQELTTISLAGTQVFLENKLPKWMAKEIEEQQIVTDFLAEQIKPYSLNTTISDVETIRAGNLWHLKTQIVSKIALGSKLKSIVESLHPTPAVCGYPKEKAKDFILKNENYKREYYTGFLGELNLKTTNTRNTNKRNVENNAYQTIKTQSNFYVNLRCMQLKDNKVYIYVGGGITKDSVAENEWEETVNKAKTIGMVLS